MTGTLSPGMTGTLSPGISGTLSPEYSCEHDISQQTVKNLIEKGLAFIAHVDKQWAEKSKI